jgi:hypothetical protein
MSLDARDELKASLRNAFPAIPFKGRVAEADGSEWTEELDDELALGEMLRGREWPSIPADFIDTHAADLPLLTPEAFVAFFPAWVVRSLDRIEMQDRVLEHTIYSLSPADCSENGAHTGSVVDTMIREDQQSRIRLFTANQIAAIVAFLEFVATDRKLEWMKADALKARDALLGASFRNLDDR